MKRYIVLFNLLLLFGFVVGNKAVAECPPGWFERSVIIDNYPYCSPILVKFCLWCSITSPNMQFQVTQITLLNPSNCQGFLLESFMRFLTERILDNYFEFCPGAYIPCEAGRQEIWVARPLCWYENPLQSYDFFSCNDAKCVEQWFVCIRDGNPDKVIGQAYIVGEQGQDCLNYSEGNRVPGVCFHINTR